MIRLLLWIWRHLIIGQPFKFKLFRSACARKTSPHGHDVYAATYCEHGLCPECCDARCKCLDHQIAETKEQRRLFAAELGHGKTG